MGISKGFSNPPPKLPTRGKFIAPGSFSRLVERRRLAPGDVIILGIVATVSVTVGAVALVTSFPLHHSLPLVALGISLVVPMFAIGAWTDFAFRKITFSRWTYVDPTILRRQLIALILFVVGAVSALALFQPLFGQGYASVLALVLVWLFFLPMLLFLRREFRVEGPGNWLRRFGSSWPEFKTSLGPLASGAGFEIRLETASLPGSSEWCTILRGGRGVGSVRPMRKRGVVAHVTSGLEADAVKGIVEQATKSIR